MKPMRSCSKAWVSEPGVALVGVSRATGILGGFLRRMGKGREAWVSESYWCSL